MIQGNKLPRTVGELRKLIRDMPADVRFEIDVHGYIGEVNGAILEFEHRPLGRDALVLNIDVDC